VVRWQQGESARFENLPQLPGEAPEEMGVLEPRETGKCTMFVYGGTCSRRALFDMFTAMVMAQKTQIRTTHTAQESITQESITQESIAQEPADSPTPTIAQYNYDEPPDNSIVPPMHMLAYAPDHARIAATRCGFTPVVHNRATMYFEQC
jgi:hypothetical protein